MGTWGTGILHNDTTADILIGKIKSAEFLWLGVGTPIGDWTKIESLIEEQLGPLKKKKSDKPVNVTVSQFLKRNEKLERVLVEWDKKIFREKLNTPKIA